MNITTSLILNPQLILNLNMNITTSLILNPLPFDEDDFNKYKNYPI
jgi:hypothetical protein